MKVCQSDPQLTHLSDTAPRPHSSLCWLHHEQASVKPEALYFAPRKEAEE
jgi:hypothetical protein